jgi:ATPase, YjeE family
MTNKGVFSLEALPEVAEALLQELKGKNVWAFYGSMGVGKTTLIKALCVALGVTDWVNSPTFTLVNEYRAAGGRDVFHFDCYRLKDLQEARDLGCDEYFYSQGLCLIEWPERIEALLPEETVRIYLKETPDGLREISIG